MNDFKQQTKLKTIVDDIFYNLVEYQENQNEKLNERVFEEVETQEEYYDVHTTIIRRENIELVDGYLYPILEADYEKPELDKEEFLDKLEEQDCVRVGKIYLPLEYPKIKELKEQDRKFSGKVICEGKESYSLTIRLAPIQAYLDKEQELYRNFIANNIGWRTIYNPWIRRFFEMKIVDFDEEILELDNFEDIDVDLGDLEEEKKSDLIPVWNIEKIKLNCDGFPIPAKDQVNYEHIISLQEMNQDNGYVVSDKNEDIISVRRTKENLKIMTDQEEAQFWNIFKIVQNRPQTLELNFPVKKNSREENYINKYAVNRSKVIRTKAEINRLANSFQILDKIKLDSVKIKEGKSTDADNYYYNKYIKDEIRLNKFKNIMLLKFTLMDKDNFQYDVLSFIVSEIQMYFPEYICKGVLL